MGYRYPKGESYYDVINRIQPLIVELERIKTPTVVISHNAVLRCLYGYFAVLKVDSICDIEFPLHTVLKITPQTYGYQEEIFSFDINTGNIKTFSTLEEKYEAESGKTERHKNYVKKSKQKLSFDDIDLNIPKKGFPSMNALMKAHLSCSDISSMQIHDVEKEEFQKNEIEMERKAKNKGTGLKRVK